MNKLVTAMVLLTISLSANAGNARMYDPLCDYYETTYGPFITDDVSQQEVDESDYDWPYGFKVDPEPQTEEIVVNGLNYPYGFE